MGDVDFRPDAARAIYLAGEINDELVDRLLPDIIRFRSDSERAITVYIDSAGGRVAQAERLQSLLTDCSQDGKFCKFLTFALGQAASAAAILLARGDYAIAAPGASIHFHGLRQQAVSNVTKERAEALSALLHEENAKSALRLANACVDRVIWLLGVVRQELGVTADHPELVKRFSEVIASKLTHDNASLVRRAFEKSQGTAKLSEYVFSKINWKNPSKIAIVKMQADVLKRIIDYEVRRQPAGFSFSEDGLACLKSDFLQLIDYFGGQHQRHLKAVRDRYATIFLTPDERQHIKSFAASKAKEQKEWQEKTVSPRMLPLWYFVVSMCRLLYEGENPLTAREGFWLGIVDEVAGSDLPCLRVAAEAAAEEPPPAALPPAAL